MFTAHYVRLGSAIALCADVRDRSNTSNYVFEFKYLLTLSVKPYWWASTRLLRLRGRPRDLCTKRDLIERRTKIEWFILNGEHLCVDLFGLRCEGLLTTSQGRFISDDEISMMFWRRWEQDDPESPILDRLRKMHAENQVLYKAIYPKDLNARRRRQEDSAARIELLDAAKEGDQGTGQDRDLAPCGTHRVRASIAPTCA